MLFAMSDEDEGQCREKLERLGHWGDTSEEREKTKSERMKKLAKRMQEPMAAEAIQDHKDHPATKAPQRRPPPPPTSLTRNRRMKKLQELLREGDFFSRGCLRMILNPSLCFVPDQQRAGYPPLSTFCTIFRRFATMGLDIPCFLRP